MARRPARSPITAPARVAASACRRSASTGAATPAVPWPGSTACRFSESPPCRHSGPAPGSDPRGTGPHGPPLAVAGYNHLMNRGPAKALAACALAACLAACGGNATADHGRVVIFGIDGADWQVIEPLVA